MEDQDKRASVGAQDWEIVGDEVVAAILEKLKPALRKASEAIYEDLLYTAQDYLIDNVRWNIRSQIDAAERQAQNDRIRARETAEVLRTVREYVDDVTTGGLVSANGVDLKNLAKDDIKIIDAAIQRAGL